MDLRLLFLRATGSGWSPHPLTPTAGDGAITRPAFSSGSEPGTPDLFQGQPGRQ